MFRALNYLILTLSLVLTVTIHGSAASTSTDKPKLRTVETAPRFDRWVRASERRNINRDFKLWHDEINNQSNPYATAQIVARQNKLPIYRFSFGDPQSQNRILITSGVHAGSEPLVVTAAHRLIEELHKESLSLQNKNQDSYIVIYPMLNPWSYMKKSRRDESGIDLNRIFFEEKIEVKAMQDFTTSLKGEYFDLALDLHGGHFRKHFFVVQADDDYGLAKRALKVFPESFLLPSVSGKYPGYAHFLSDPERYFMSSPGITRTETKGTLKTYLTKFARHSYTLEYPGHVLPEDSVHYYLVMIRSFIAESLARKHYSPRSAAAGM